MNGTDYSSEDYLGPAASRRSDRSHRRSQIYFVPRNLSVRVPDWFAQGRQVAVSWFAGADRPALLTEGSSVVMAHLNLARDLLSIAVPYDHPEVAHEIFVDVVEGPIALISMLCAGILPIPWKDRHRSRQSTMKGRKNMIQRTAAVRPHRVTLARLIAASVLAGGLALTGTGVASAETSSGPVSTGVALVDTPASGSTSAAPARHKRHDSREYRRGHRDGFRQGTRDGHEDGLRRWERPFSVQHADLDPYTRGFEAGYAKGYRIAHSVLCW